MRADGKRLRHSDPMYTVAAHIMARRSDAMNMTTIDIPVDPMQRYINRTRKEGRAVSHLALVLAAYVRTLADYPALNRFVVNKRIFARNEICVGMVVLKAGQDGGTMSKIHLLPDDTIDEVNEKINRYVADNRAVPEKNSTEKLIKILLGLPGLLRVGVPFFKWLDKHGLLPKAIIDASPFHASMSITNLASIKTDSIYHHCYDFGTTSLFLAMGNFHEVAQRHQGEIVFERCMPIGAVMDERICDGHYFATAFRTFKRYLAQPELLEQKPAAVKPDPEL